MGCDAHAKRGCCRARIEELDSCMERKVMTSVDMMIRPRVWHKGKGMVLLFTVMEGICDLHDLDSLESGRQAISLTILPSHESIHDRTWLSRSAGKHPTSILRVEATRTSNSLSLLMPSS